jgi:hypothetical protein
MNPPSFFLLSQIGRLAVKTLPTLINVTFHVKTGARFLIAHGVCSHSRASLTTEIHCCMQQRIILFFEKEPIRPTPLFFLGSLQVTSETEIVAHTQQMLKEIREIQNEKGINSCLSDGSPGEIRTLVSGSRARHA